MKSINFLFSFVLCCAVFFTANSFAQVTIGSSIPPNRGALLDLKEQDNDVYYSNAAKGLGMPRVNLTDVERLSPMYSYTDAENTPDATTLSIHTGLIVYNVNEDLSNPNKLLCRGMYVWDGSAWIALKSLVAKETATTITDLDGNVYSIKRFGTAVWMTSNLRNTLNACGSPIDAIDGMRLNPGYYSSLGVKAVKTKSDLRTGTPTITIGEGLAANPPSVSFNESDFATKFGLLYTQEQAKKACPGGWHLPTTADWDNLKNFIDPNVNQNESGKRMKANNNYYRSADTAPSTYAFGGYPAGDVNNSGFNALPAGNVNAGGQTGGHFGVYPYWWTANSGEYRMTSTGSNSAFYTRSGDMNGYYFSVRCVKN